MRGNYYRFAKVSNDVWEGYGPGHVTTFKGMDAETMDKWNNYVTRYNRKNPESPMDRTEYFNFMIEEIW